MKPFLLLAIIVYILVFAAWARADEGACYQAQALADEWRGAVLHLADMKRLASQVCTERALRKECARQRLEIRAFETELMDLEFAAIAAHRACASSKAARKANSS